MMSRPSSRGSSTPGSESVNKWKIPHYYRRSSAASSQQSSGSEAGTPVTPGMNSMSSPKKVLVEDPKKGKKRPVYRSRMNSRKKAGEMVFVNYTVQDTAPEEGEVEVPTSELPPMAASPVIGHKKKSSRSRMLKIFGSSKESPKVDEETHLAAFAENDGMYEPEAYLSASKRSCSSFLRYGRFHHAHSKRSEPSADYAPEEVVPKSSQSPNLVKPASTGIFSGNSSRKVKYLGGMVKNDSSIDPGYVQQNATGISEGPVVAGKPSDDNDASIAFSKMFSRNGANTSGSMSSLISLNQNIQDQQPHSHSGTGIPALKKNMSASSISSLSYRCSPNRTASPARPRSSTRGSYNCGVSLHGVVDTEEGGNPILSATDTYLDSRVGNRNGSILRHKKKQDSISDSHRFYSTSASASTILNNNNSSAVTPSSSSLVTPPPFTPGYSLPSNTSASSTPSVMEYAPGSQPATFSGLANGASTSGHHSSFNIAQPCLERDSSSEIFFGDSDIPTPVDSQPALRGIAKATLKEDEEEEFNERDHGIAHGAITNSKSRNSLVRQKADNLDLVLPHGSSTGSSQVGSILTNSTSSITDTSMMGNWQDSSCYASFDAGVGFKAENFEKAASGRAPKMSTTTVAIGRTSSKNSDYMAVSHTDAQGRDLGMCAQFDFENAAAFFHEQSKNMTSDYGYTAEQTAQRANTPVDEQASAVTSIANYSPSAAATISMDEAANSSLNYREFDRPHYAHPMVHSTSTASQSVTGHSVGQWKSINNDLDAITDSFGISDEINDLPFTYPSIHEEQ